MSTRDAPSLGDAHCQYWIPSLPNGPQVRQYTAPSLRACGESLGSGLNFIWGNCAQNGDGSGGMAIFLTTAAAIAAIRAAGRAPNVFPGPAIPSCVPGRHLCCDIKGSKTIILYVIFRGYRKISTRYFYFFIF